MHVRDMGQNAAQALARTAISRLGSQSLSSSPSTAVATDQWLQQLWEHTSDAMALSDSGGTVLAANPAYYRLYGYGPDEVLGKSFALIFPSEQRAWAEAQYQEVFRAEQSPPVATSTVTSKTGLERIVESRVIFLAESGRRTAMLSILRDVTEEVSAQGAAARAEQELRTLLFSLSHDIKSPLAVVKGYAQTLRRYVLRHQTAPPLDRLTEGLAEIEASALRAAAMVDQLVEVATLEEGGSLPLRPSLVDLVALVRHGVDRHQRLTDEHQLVLESATASLAGFWDETRLARVVDNLLGNAIKYSPSGGLITVRIRLANAETSAPAAAESEHERQRGAACPRTGVLVSVEDNGIGIDEHDLPFVFTRFRRGSNVPENAIGSGIGLTSVEQIVHQHGGTVHIDSRLGSGTIVSVWLPIRREEGLEAQA